MNSQNRNETPPEPRAKRPLVKARRAHAPAASLLRNAPNNVGYGEAQASFEDRLRAKGDKEHSVKSATGHLNKFGGWLDAQGLGLRDVREATMDKYVLHRQTVDGVGDICRRRDVIYVKALMKHCLRNGFIARNHLAEYDLPEADKPYRKMPSFDDNWRLLQAIADKCKPENNPCRRYRNRESQKFFTARDQAITATAICTGLRVSEIFALTLADYDRANRQLVVRHSKSGKPRYVALEEDLVPFLDDWLRERPNEIVLRGMEWFQGDDSWGQPVRPTLFVSEGGKQMVQNYWGRQFKRYCAWAKVEGITFHCLRHYSGTQVLHEDAITAKNQLGHSELRTTMGYHHNDAEHVRAAVLRARPLGKVLDVGKPKRRTSLIKR